MPVENLPLWTLAPNWAETVSERLAWESTVLGSPTGAEQRFSLRSTPQRSFEAGFLPTGVERAWIDNAVLTASAVRWYVPIFDDLGRTTAATTAGTDTIPVETAGRGFYVGGFVMLRSSLFVASVHEITAIGASSLTVTPNVGTFAAGTLAVPCEPMRIEGAASLSRLADRTARARLRFTVDGPSPFTPASLGANYEGYPVLTVAPNERDDLTSTYNRILAEFATMRSRRVVVDTAGRNFSVQQHSWLVYGRAEQDALRGYFYALRGRRTATWVPTFAADLDLVLPALSSATQITVALCGYHRFGGPRFGREHIRIELRNGTAIMRRVTASAESGANEVLTLNSALGVAISPSDVKRISFMALCRLDQDSVEFVHYADKMGAMTVSAAFRTAGEFRNAPAVLPMPFFMGAATPQNCGDPLPPPPDVVLGQTYLWGDFGAPWQSRFDGIISWNQYVVDDVNASGLVTGGIVAETILVPTGATKATIRGRLVFSQIGGASAGDYTASIERSAAGGIAPWTPLLSGLVSLPGCGAIRCDRVSNPIVFGEQTFEVVAGQRIRMTFVGADTFIWYGNDPAVTFIDITWSRPGDSWFPI